MSPRPKIVVTLPAYCAERTLAKTVAALPPAAADKVILVDDASPDQTVKIARDLGIQVVVHPVNRGYGGNQKTCYTEALRDSADIVVMVHPDYQYDPAAVPLLTAPILAGDADMTFGSRFAGLGDPRGGGMPLYRYLGNRVSTTVENLLLGSRFTETHSGLRAYTRECLLSLPFLRYSDDFAFDSQLLIDAVTTGQRVVEVPIPTRYTEESSSISIRRSLRYVAESVRYCAVATTKRGRRGRRSPVVPPRRPEPVTVPAGPPVTHACVLCGGKEHVLVYPATASGRPPVEEFACTTDGLSAHDDIIQCRDCGLLSAVVPLEAAEILSNYAEVVDPTYLDEEPSRREVFTWFATAMAGHPVRGKRLLEIGANVGLFLSVADEHGWEARGIEPSAWAVEEGRRRFGVDIRQGTIESLDEPERSADVVAMFDVLEHLVDPVSALKALRPLLDDEGLLILSTVNAAGLHARVRKGSWPWFIRSHLFYFTPRTLAAMLGEAGFDLVEWTVVPRVFHLSYIAHRAGPSHGALAKAAAAVSKVVDPKVPMGWLGDIVLVAARPVPSP
ncbi:MAG: bifunctional glycosyltransferase/class I SAM-dependent methyltransferase [Actinomycetota bacterium]|nr:bifunctional glycosyltransferase/class I SAM-dependent methyltransferase [Actinomycetota bacterium]